MLYSRHATFNIIVSTTKDGLAGTRIIEKILDLLCDMTNIHLESYSQ